MADVKLSIAQGKTFSRTLRWGTKPFIYKAISAITRAAPARITAVGHGIPAGWRVAVVSALGMRQINAGNSPPKSNDFYPATVIDADTIELNDVNSSGYAAYTSGGYLQFYTPLSLAGGTARMTIRDRIGGTALVTLSSPGTGIVLDDTAKTITVTISAVTTAAYTWTKGVFELEFQDAAGVVVTLMRGTVSVTPKEIAT